jgi:hypothetical protein
MNTSPGKGGLENEQRSEAGNSAERTLRIIASLPAPEGLVDRVQAGLRAAPQTGRVLGWRGPLKPVGGWRHNGWMHSGWMRTSAARGAAAAAIVCVVAGGGWRIYSRVQPAPANVIVMPVRVAPSGGGFSQAGARRVPETLQGPVLTHPVAPETSDQKVVETAPNAHKAGSGGAVPKKKMAAARPALVPVQ